MPFKFFKHKSIKTSSTPSEYLTLDYQKNFALRSQNLCSSKSLIFACSAAQRLFAVYEQGVADVAFWSAPELKSYLNACWHVMETGKGQIDMQSFDIINFLDGQKAQAAYLVEPVALIAMIIDQILERQGKKNIAAVAVSTTLDFLDRALDEYVFNNPQLWENPPNANSMLMSGQQSTEYSDIVFRLPYVQKIISFFERDLKILTDEAFNASLVRKMHELSQTESVLNQFKFVPLKGLQPLS